MPSRIPTPRAAAGPFRAADWPNTMRSSKTPGSARVGSAPSRLRRMSAADVAVAFRRETGMDSPRAVWFQQFGSNSMLKVPPAQQFYWGNRAVPSLARVAERGGHHGAPPADEASSPSTRALIDRIGDPPHAAIEIALKLAGAEICPPHSYAEGRRRPLQGGRLAKHDAVIENARVSPRGKRPKQAQENECRCHRNRRGRRNSRLQQATKTIPIVALTDDMLGNGFVNSLSRPNGNTTGGSILAVGLYAARILEGEEPRVSSGLAAD